MSRLPQHSPWVSDLQIAKLTLPNLSAVLNLSQPWLGLHDLLADDAPQAQTNLLRIESQPGTKCESITDQYIRGNDLIVNYSQTELRPVAVHVYWRAFANGVDLIVSMQTDLLDSDPTLHIVNDVAAGELIACDARPASMLLRPKASQCSWLLAAQPSDCEEIDVAATDGGHQLTFRIFRPGLEKGVIRRARLRAALLPRNDDQRLAAASYAEFTSSALPLTT